ncbi:MAG: hypothetical protein KKH94_08100 [Candidatus Omnitrophica bacterium]|nr:hypothetical protein [Candidatus Omnitrophota bacterium]
MFEVLLAILILSIGITASLQAFRHIIEITKRSQEYFDVRLIASDCLFELFTTPKLAKQMIVTKGKKKFNNKNLTVRKEYSYQYEWDDVALSRGNEDGGTDKGDVSSEATTVSYKKATTYILLNDNTVFDVETFHALREKGN